MTVYISLHGSKRELLSNSRPAGPINPSEIAAITVRVRSIGDVKALEQTTGSYRGRQGEIHIPKHLDKIVTGIFGFDMRPKRRHGRRQWVKAESGPDGTNGVAATAFANRYNFPTTDDNGASLDGTGQTIAIIKLGGGYRTSDLAAYFQEIAIPMPIVTAVQVGAGNNPGDPNGSDGEVMLDIEVAGAVVPKAKLVIYFAPNNRDKGFLGAIGAAVHDA
ncbi:hypothetical protein CPB97_000351 [Podila verticillata]|nr:hypothetical protein CPB97_000351 [Podila verticillata]